VDAIGRTIVIKTTPKGGKNSLSYSVGKVSSLARYRTTSAFAVYPKDLRLTPHISYYSTYKSGVNRGFLVFDEKSLKSCVSIPK
jgi:hypothetical protein